jgi:hypothetical protein
VRDPGEIGLLSQALELLEGQFDGEVGSAAFHFGGAAGGIGHELEDDCLESRLGTPVFRKRLQPNIGVALELLQHIRARPDGSSFEALRASGGVSLLGQHIAR